MTLIGGPYNGRSISDSGTVRIRMAIYSPRRVIGCRAGVAVYEPSSDRTCAFWLENVWEGTLEEVVG